ncbi:MAG: hypothetical protein WCF67_19575 [Chitinophagaceae bacterium]
MKKLQTIRVSKSRRRFSLLFSLLIIFSPASFAQTHSFDVFTYQPPPFFTKSSLPSRLQFSMVNKDGTFCTITLYKSGPAKEDSTYLMAQWNRVVVKTLTGASVVFAFSDKSFKGPVEAFSANLHLKDQQ